MKLFLAILLALYACACAYPSSVAEEAQQETLETVNMPLAVDLDIEHVRQARGGGKCGGVSGRRCGGGGPPYRGSGNGGFGGGSKASASASASSSSYGSYGSYGR